MTGRTVGHRQQEGLLVSPQSQTQLLRAVGDTTHTDASNFHCQQYGCFMLCAKCCVVVAGDDLWTTSCSLTPSLTGTDFLNSTENNTEKKHTKCVAMVTTDNKETNF